MEKPDFVKCHSCSKDNKRDETISHKRKRYCNPCFDLLFRECDECCETIHREEVYFADGEDLCKKCHATRESIKDYSYKPSPRFQKTKSERESKQKHREYYGIEIELESRGGSRNKAAEEVSKVSKYLYIKTDGSLSNGFEIVTHPMSQAFFKKRFSLRKLMKVCKENGMKAEDSCGLHVHVSKASLRAINWWKVAMFMSKCGKQTVKFSRREEYNMSRWAAIPDLGKVNSHFKRNIKKKPRNEMISYNSRYIAINFTDKTVEFRLFKSTNDPDDITNAINFIHTLLEFTRRYGIAFFARNDARVLWKEYCAFAYSFNGSFFKYMKKKKLIAA